MVYKHIIMGFFDRFKKNDTTETENSNPAPKLNIFNKIKKKTNNILKKAPSNNFQTNTNSRNGFNNSRIETPGILDGVPSSSWVHAYRDLNRKYIDLSGKYDILSGNYDVLDGNYEILSGNYDVLDGNYEILSGNYDVLDGSYNTLSGNYSGDIKDATKQLNTKAKLQNEELIPKFSVKQSKVQYQTEQISSLNYYVFYLIWIYAFLAAFFMINLFISKKTKQISLYVKLLIALLLFLYPYYVTSLQDLLYEIGRYAGNMLYGSVYHSPDY